MPKTQAVTAKPSPISEESAFANSSSRVRAHEIAAFRVERVDARVQIGHGANGHDCAAVLSDNNVAFVKTLDGYQCLVHTEHL